MQQLLLALAVLVPPLSVCASSTDDWETFKRLHSREYTPEEEHLRRQVFSENLDFIRRHNTGYAAGLSTFSVAVNQFADLTKAEFRQLVLSQGAPSARHGRLQGAPSARHGRLQGAPSQFDWRDQGVPITIENQGINDGWTIPVVNAVQDDVFISSGQVVSLSNQNVLDCVSWPSVIDGLVYAREHGLASEADYPTTGRREACRREVPVTARVTTVTQVTDGDELALQTGLLLNPVAAEIDAGEPSFQFYSSGIYDEPKCNVSEIDHGILLVGYGVQRGVDFWTLANSWGINWGEDGFMRMKRGVNMCGVASYAAYPNGMQAS